MSGLCCWSVGTAGINSINKFSFENCFSFGYYSAQYLQGPPEPTSQRAHSRLAKVLLLRGLDGGQLGLQVTVLLTLGDGHLAMVERYHQFSNVTTNLWEILEGTARLQAVLV